VVDEAEIHRMANSRDVEERKEAAEQLRKNFADLPDKKQAWKDLIKLTSDTDSDVNWCPPSTLGNAFAHLPDKKQAWEDLHRLTSDTDSGVRRSVASALGSAFAHVPEKKRAWEDLHKLTSDAHRDVREDAAFALGNAFVHLPEKKRAWEDLHRLISDTHSYVRGVAASAFGNAFAYVPDKIQTWEDLHRLTSDSDNYVRRSAASALGNAFVHLPEKKQAWDDLHRLTSDTECEVRRHAASALGNAFAHVPEKKQAWEDLHRLTTNTDTDVLRGAASALGNAFAHVPDKKQAWDDLHGLTSDSDSYVRRSAASALGSSFAYVPDKKQAWYDLIRLTSDNNGDVRASAYHSLGKASIFKAANAENDIDLKKEMEAAIGYFEKSSRQVIWSNPAKFCIPFYRSFFTLIFKKAETEAEVQKYIAEAKSVVEGSESKEKLLEAVENLGNALKEAQKARDFSDVKADLNAYRRYCERASELLDTTEEKMPGASRLIRKGLPIIDERIKGIIAEIQEKAKALCKQTRGTTFEDLGKNVYRIGQNLLVENPAILEKRLNDFQINLSAICARTSEINVGEACDLLKRANNEPILENRIQLMDDAISKILPHIGNVTNIQISNSNNVQITTANGTTQKMSIEIPEEKTIK
jgi:HEAT repeat protein